MKNRDILISGASIAGLALAYWLRQYGFNPTVVEQAPAPRRRLCGRPSWGSTGGG